MCGIAGAVGAGAESVDAGGATAYAERHLEGKADHGELLWLLLTFELWAQRLLDRVEA